MNKLTPHLLVLAALTAPPVFAQTSTTQPATQPAVVLCAAATEIQTKVMEIAPRCVATTVGIVLKTDEGGMVGMASGSGVVVSADGLIMTAGHVIEKPGTALTIRFPDGKVVKGVAVGLDHAADTGLARITDPAPEAGWPFAAVAPDDSANVGEWVLATGNPGSIVLDRNPPLRMGRVTIHNSKTIETNCAVEPGDSGGPIFDLQGRVVGINSRIATTNGAPIRIKEYLTMHVPVSMFSTEMKDLLAGENANPNAVIGKNSQQRLTPRAKARLAKMQQFQAAVKKLLAGHDPEVIKLMTDSAKDPRHTPMTPELMDHLIQKAGLAQSATQPTTRQLADAPATQPTTGPALAAATGQATTAPTTQSVTRGIPANLRPMMAAQIKRSLQSQFPDAKVSDDVVNRIMDRSTFDHGHLNIITDEQDLQAMGVLPQAMASRIVDGEHSNRLAVEVGKTSLQTLSMVTPSLQAAGDCLVEIRDAGKTVLLGTIVESNGYIVTKASDLPAHPTVVLPDGRTMTPRIIGKDPATDLALLKVATHGLTAVNFVSTAPLGEWLSAPTANPNEPAIGLVSDIARPIPKAFAHFAGEQKLMLGLGFTGPSMIVGMISPGMPAEVAGMKIGDEVFELDGHPATDPAEFTTQIRTHKAGDTISLKIHRDGKDIELNPVLGAMKATTQTTTGVGEADNVSGGGLSKRRTNFPMAIQTDAAIWADQVGGPLINLQGETVGVTIARYDRVCTFALPAELVLETVAKLKVGPTTQP